MDSSVSIMASFATMKNLVDEKRYQNPYQLLAEFIMNVIREESLYMFTAAEMNNKLQVLFGFDIPEYVVRRAARSISVISLNNGTFSISPKDIVKDKNFEGKKDTAERENSEIVELLVSFAKKSERKRLIQRDLLAQELVAFLVDDHQQNQDVQYRDLIYKFILENEDNDKVQNALASIREGSILYIGLTQNIVEIGSIKKPLVVFLGTEILFSLCGFNGEIHKRFAEDLYRQISLANRSEKKIMIRYFSETKNEIERFFSSAEFIVEGRTPLVDTVAMRNIINGCTTVGDVKVKKADFYNKLQNCETFEDKKQDYYSDEDAIFNLEELEFDDKLFESVKLISHINKLRKGKQCESVLDSEYIFVTNSGSTLKKSRELADRLRAEQEEQDKYYSCEYAVSMDRMTNLLWCKLGGAFGKKDYPSNVNAVNRTRVVLSSKIAQNVSKVFDKTKKEYESGEISKDQMAARIMALREKPIAPEDIKHESIAEDMDFSSEYMARFENEVLSNKKAVHEKEQEINDIKESAQAALSRKDAKIAEKEKAIQEKDKKNREINSELSRYKELEKANAKKREHRVSTLRFIRSITWKILATIAIIIFSFWAVPLAFPNEGNAMIVTLSIAPGLISFVFSIWKIIKKDYQKYISKKE